MQLKIGQRVKWNGSESKHGKCNWLRRGMTGIVTNYHPAIRGTGLIFNNVIDTGLIAYWTICFGAAGTRCVDRTNMSRCIIIE